MIHIISQNLLEDIYKMVWNSSKYKWYDIVVILLVWLECPEEYNLYSEWEGIKTVTEKICNLKLY